MKILGTSWTTSLFGMLVMVFGALAQVGPDDWQPWMILLAEFSAGAGLLMAKSHNVTNAPRPAEAAVAVPSSDTAVPMGIPIRKIHP
jgi:hypothetical protein